MTSRGREISVVGATIATEEGDRPVRARVVVGADGHASRVARLVGASTQEAIPASRAMYYRYLRGWMDLRVRPTIPIVGGR